MVLEVIVDLSNDSIDRTFDYEGDDCPLGSRVAVDFGSKHLIGFVIGKKETSSYKNLKKAKYLDSPVNDEQLQLMDFMRKSYNLRYIDVLRLFIPSKLREERNPEYAQLFLEIDKSRTFDELIGVIGTRSPKQAECLEYIREKGQFMSLLINLFGASAVGGLRKKGVVKESLVHERSTPMELCINKKERVVLTEPQKHAVDAVTDGDGVYLLHGVTGSGKTEVYQNVIENMLSKGKTAIMLVPEISLTPQVLGIFRGRFGDSVAILHSNLNASEKYDEWKRLKTGQAKIAIGPRSAIFAPLRNIGVIIIDEEHDTSYISDNNPRYDTRTVAEYRAKLAGAPLILGSATPDMETFQKADSGKYHLLTLPNRVAKHELSEMEIIDMTEEFRMGNRGIISDALKTALTETLNKKEQAMILLNRRGFASFLRCNKCGYIAKCEDCDVSLTYHKDVNELKCHYCGRRYHMLSKCPSCGSTSIKQGRVGTEKVVEEIKSFLPEARVLRMDNDTTRVKDGYSKILTPFSNQEVDILVGTQMIAKGHDFPNVTLVGILEADAALYFSDYRSSERTFQLITQVAGRAGRAEKEGRVILQTYNPNHYVFRFGKSYDYIGFYKKEINARMVTKFPPFTKIVRISVNSVDEQDCLDSTKVCYQAVRELEKEYGKFVYLGAQKSPITRMNGLIRYQVLMRLVPDMYYQIIDKIYKIVDSNKPKKGNIFVETNPQSLT